MKQTSATTATLIQDWAGSFAAEAKAFRAQAHRHFGLCVLFDQARIRARVRDALRLQYSHGIEIGDCKVSLLVSHDATIGSRFRGIAVVGDLKALDAGWVDAYICSKIAAGALRPAPWEWPVLV